MRKQDDKLGEDQSFGITTIDQALSLVILTCRPYLDESRRRKDLFDKNLNLIRFNLPAQHFKNLF